MLPPRFLVFTSSRQSRKRIRSRHCSRAQNRSCSDRQHLVGPARYSSCTCVIIINICTSVYSHWFPTAKLFFSRQSPSPDYTVSALNQTVRFNQSTSAPLVGNHARALPRRKTCVPRSCIIFGVALWSHWPRLPHRFPQAVLDGGQLQEHKRWTCACTRQRIFALLSHKQ